MMIPGKPLPIAMVMIFSTKIDKKTGVKEDAYRYYISSKKGTAAFFNHAIRAHWGIENKLHWMLYVAFREDDSRKHFQMLPKTSRFLKRSF